MTKVRINDSLPGRAISYDGTHLFAFSSSRSIYMRICNILAIFLHRLVLRQDVTRSEVKH